MRGGDAYPVLHVLADVAEWRDAALVETTVSEPLAVSALAVAGADARGVLVASHSADPRGVVVGGLGVETVRVRRLDETTAEEAITAPESFRGAGPTSCRRPAASSRLELAPYAVVRIET